MNILRLIALCLGALLITACGDETKCDGSCSPGDGGGSGGSGGTGGIAGAGGTGGTTSGNGGSGGNGGAPAGHWTEVRAEACTNEQASLVVRTNLFQEVFQVVVSPRLEVGFSSEATVLGYEENMTVIKLRTASGTQVQIKWPGVINDFDVDETILLEQTRDWTILRKKDRPFAAAMFQRNGPIADEVLEPLPLGGPTLRFAMQCNMSDNPSCRLDAVSLQTGEGDDLHVFESGTIVSFGNWTISNRSALQDGSGCPDDVAFRSLIWAHGGQ